MRSNFNDTSKSVNYGIEANEIDKLGAFGYKSKKLEVQLEQILNF